MLVLRPRAILVRYEPSERHTNQQNLQKQQQQKQQQKQQPSNGGSATGGGGGGGDGEDVDEVTAVVDPQEMHQLQQSQSQLTQSPTKGVSKDTFRVTPETLRVAPGEQVNKTTQCTLVASNTQYYLLTYFILY